MPAPVLAFPSAGPERLVDDRLDRTRATAASHAAAKASVYLLGIAGKLLRSADGVADIVVADDVAGTDNHGARRIFRKDIGFDIEVGSTKQKEKWLF